MLLSQHLFIYLSFNLLFYHQVSTVMSILLLHLIPLISLCYVNSAIYIAIRWVACDLIQGDDT